jgi:6-phosphogluconolactonase (cycloisomerase 2 family)/uncharacterized protein YjdB
MAMAGTLLLAALLTACSSHGSSTSISITTAPGGGTQLTSIEVGPPNASIPLGLVHQFTATGLYSNGTKLDLSTSVTWTSSNAAAASISNVASSVGLVTAIKAGTTTITATLGSMAGTTTLTVTAATLESIDVTPANPSVANGSHKQFTATGIYTDKSTQDITNSVTWASATPSATISNTAGSLGLATAALPGTSVITATLGSVSSSTTLTVAAATLVSVTITPAQPTVPKGLTRQFTATAVYSDNSTQDVTQSAIWNSSDSTVVSISNATGSIGLATAVTVGPATLSAAFGGMSNSTVLTVRAATLSSITVTAPVAKLAKGTSQQYVATGTYSDASTQVLTTTAIWKSSATTIATISNAQGFEGQVRAAAVGNATITATFGGVSDSTLLAVTAATLTTLSVTPVNQHIALSTHEQYAATGIYSDNTTQDLTTVVTWKSSTAAVTISNVPGSNGLATGAAVGTAVILAIDPTSGLTGSTNLTVTGASLVSIAVTPTTLSIAKGGTQQFSAVGTYSDGSTQPLTTAAMWTSSNAAIASISNSTGSNGLASSLTAGVTSIAATLGTVTSSVTLTITPATLMSITVRSRTSASSMANRTTLQLTATGTYSDASTQDLTSSVTWSSSNSTVVTIGNIAGSYGLATAQTPGSATVTATYGGIAATYPLTVTSAALVSIAVTPTAPTIVNGSAEQFVATGTYADGSTQITTTTVTWNSSAPTVALFGNAAGSKGLATAIAVGTSTITAIDPTTNISGTTTLTVIEYAYAANFGGNTLSQYTVGPTGALTPMSNPTVAAGSNPFAVVVDPSSRYVYAVNFDRQSFTTASTLSQYTISQTDGSLTPMAPPNVPTGDNPNGIAVDPLGRAVYVANSYPISSSSVSQYTISRTDGSLTAMNPATVLAGSGAATVTVDPSGTHAYVTNYNDNTISQYTIDPATGSLNPMQNTPPAVTGTGPNYLVVDPSGKNVYVANLAGGTVYQFVIQPDGSLGSYVATVTTGAPRSLAIAPNGAALYVANGTDDNVWQFKIGVGGALTPMTPQTVSPGVGSNPNSITVDPSGAYAYVANRGSQANGPGNGTTVSQYSIAADGTLQALTPPTVPAGPGPTSVVVAR